MSDCSCDTPGFNQNGSGLVKIDSSDTTANFLNSKLVAGTNVSFAINNVGGNETLTINAAGGALDHKVSVSATDTTPGFLQQKLLAGTGVSLTKENGGANEDLRVANTGIITIQNDGAGIPHEPTLNVINGNIVDNPGNTSTDLTLSYQTITDNDGIVYPQEANLEFVTTGFIISDDPGVNATRIRLNGSLLPTVTGADNGDTIAVAGGAWALVLNPRIHLVAQNAAIGATNVFGAAPPAGLFRVSAFLDVTTNGTSGTLATKINFTPDDGVADSVIVTSALDTSVVGSSSGSVTIESNGAVNITYEVDAAALVTGGTLVYTLRIVVESL